jgi:hypothetical protein
MPGEPDDVRPIVTQSSDGELTCFMCGEAGSSADDHSVSVEAHGGGYIVSEKIGGR